MDHVFVPLLCEDEPKNFFGRSVYLLLPELGDIHTLR